MTRWKFVQAKHYTPNRRGPLRLIVVHDMEAPEKSTTAEGVANYFARGSVVASAHLCVDNDSVVQCVKAGDVAYAAPGANSDGFQIELAGYARQTRAEWLDPYSDKVLTWGALAAAQVVALSRWLGVDIPVRRLTVAEIRAGHRGFAGHADITAAYRKSTHTDPGGNFPWDTFLARTRWWLGQNPPIQFQ